ncbi:MAG: hypothetical protein IJ068_05795 [Bacilli bacterium]|nr:hypothetical protein [Bacilli bacterium]
MTIRYLYMKFVGLLLVIVGFSYSLTSFNNFFSFIFKTRIFPANLNVFLVSIGLIIPLFIFVYGVYFYFYSDFNITKINKFIFITNIMFLIVSIVMLIFKYLYNINNMVLFQLFEFIHISLVPCLILLGFLGIYGCIKYKY